MDFVLVKTPSGDIGAGRLLAIVQTQKALSYCILLFSLSLSFIDILSFCLFPRATGTTDICGAIDFFFSFFFFTFLPRLREGLEFWDDAFPGGGLLGIMATDSRYSQCQIFVTWYHVMILRMNGIDQ